MNARRRLLLGCSLVIGVGAYAAASLDAHDLFLKPRDFVVRHGDSVHVRVLNGTFTSSESGVAPDRLRELSVAGPDGVSHPALDAWSASGKESAWRVGLGGPGTYVLGASLAPKTIRLTGAQFTEYLTEEGLPDVLAARRTGGIMATPAHERYAKHVKALVLVTGRGAPTADTAFRTVLGYPAELVPLSNPYLLKPGATLVVRALVDGSPVVRQVVLSGGRTADGKPIVEQRVRTDAAGNASISLSRRGTWYVKFIQMTPVPSSAGDSVTHESKWATLTFALP
jgi:uncharacterized GH25 family protein